MRLNSYIPLFLSGWMCLLLCAGCSNRVNTPYTRAYHEFVTRYNVYHNAEKAFYDILDEQLENFQDDYSRLLPLYTSSLDPSKSGEGGPFDVVITKTEKAIRKHSISAKPRRDPSKPQSREYRKWLAQSEFNPFIHRAWLLMGKAHMQNGDHEQALATFNEMIRLFGQEPDVAHEARLWIARTYIKMERMYEAEQAIYALKTTHLPPHLNGLFTETYAYYLLQNREYTDAIPYLNELIDAEKRFKQKKRLQFLLGQLYTVSGEKEQAFQAFNSLKKLGTPHEFMWNATTYQLALTTGRQHQKIQNEWSRLNRRASDTDTLSIYRNIYNIGLLAGNDSLVQDLYGNQLAFDPTATPIDTASIRSEVNPVTSRSLDETLADETTPEDHWSFFRSRWTRGASFRQASNRSNQNKSTENEPPLFSNKRDTSHVVLLVTEQQKTNKEQLLFSVTDFNFTRFQLRTFNATFTPLTQTEVLAIRSFHSFEEASRYTGLMGTDSLFRTTIPEGIIPIVISEENLALLQMGATMDEYLAFLTIAFDVHPTPLGTGIPTIQIAESGAPHSTSIDLSIPDELESTPYHAPYRADTLYQPATPQELKRQLKQKETQALRQSDETGTTKSRKQLSKERERQRQEKIKQREQELKKRQREREAQLKQREKERRRQISKQRQGRSDTTPLPETDAPETDANETKPFIYGNKSL